MPLPMPLWTWYESWYYAIHQQINAWSYCLHNFNKVLDVGWFYTICIFRLLVHWLSLERLIGWVINSMFTIANLLYTQLPVLSHYSYFVSFFPFSWMGSLQERWVLIQCLGPILIHLLTRLNFLGWGLWLMKFLVWYPVILWLMCLSLLLIMPVQVLISCVALAMVEKELLNRE